MSGARCHICGPHVPPSLPCIECGRPTIGRDDAGQPHHQYHVAGPDGPLLRPCAELHVRTARNLRDIAAIRERAETWPEPDTDH